MRGFISVFTCLLATSGMAWAEPCRVAQTATLNVYGEPNGRIVGTLNEGTIVSMSSVITVQRHRWARIVPQQGKDRLGAPQLSALRFLVKTFQVEAIDSRA
jgi:hypothetical protein